MTSMLNRLGNPFISAILRSPIHGLLSGRIMLISFNGRKSGKRYTTPVGFLRDDGIYWVTSQRDRKWWRNMRGGAEVTLRVEGEQVKGWAEAIEGPEEVAESLTDYLRKVPGQARYYGVGLGPDGIPNAEDVARASSQRVMVKVQRRG